MWKADGYFSNDKKVNSNDKIFNRTIEHLYGSPDDVSLIDPGFEDLSIEEKNSIKELSKLIGFPPGIIQFFIKNEIPEGWLECDGRPLEKDGKYNELFQIIGTTYGVYGNKFRIPNFRNSFFRSIDNKNTNNIDPGRTLGVLQSNAMKEHTHNITLKSHTHTVGNVGDHTHGQGTRWNTTQQWGPAKNIPKPGKNAGHWNINHNGTVGHSGNHTHTIDDKEFIYHTYYDTQPHLRALENVPKHVNLIACIKY